MDSKHRKQFYVLTPWVDVVEEESSSARSNNAKPEANLAELSHYDPSIGEKLKAKKIDSTPSSSQEHSTLLAETLEKPNLSHFEESNFENDPVTTLEDLVRTSLGSSAINVAEESGKFHVTNNLATLELPADDSAPPQRRNSRRLIDINNKESVDLSDLGIRTDSKHRFRSLSYDDRPV